MAAAGASGLAALGSSLAIATTDAIVLSTDSGDPIQNVSEGQSTGAVRVARFADTGNAAECNVARYTASIGWGDGKTSAGSLTCEVVTPSPAPSGLGLPATFASYSVTGAHTYDDSGTYNIVVTARDTEDNQSKSAQTDTVSISDLALHSADEGAPSVSGVEGNALDVIAHFSDDNNSFPDSALTATINWGDGSTSPGSVGLCDCQSHYHVTGSHAYDAPPTAGQKYTVTVTLQDDGGKSATVTGSATVSDGKLTAGAAKTLIVANGTVSSQVVGSFTDEAGTQAAIGDFTATINWGDNATSGGNVTKTAAGAFSVSGSHVYATGGHKSIAVTVKDAEGSTVTLTASATVPVLALTGGSGRPAWPPAPTMLLVLGALIAMIGAAVRLARG